MLFVEFEINVKCFVSLLFDVVIKLVMILLCLFKYFVVECKIILMFKFNGFW